MCIRSVIVLHVISCNSFDYVPFDYLENKINCFASDILFMQVIIL
jgi:hypothetical protein